MSNRVPRHVAIIMDGNGRWAERRHRPRIFGHIRGASRVKSLVREANQQGIQALTFFAFSTENWTRPEEEKQVLWRLLKRYLDKEVAELAQENVRLNVIGEIEKLSPELQNQVRASIERLSRNTGLELTFAISYGGRRELARAARLFAKDCLEGRRKPEEMNEDLMRDYLWTAGLGELANVDLVIRTSGEQRISNFMLYQAAYAEYVFVPELWPEFDVSHFQKALTEYSSRNRRFGGLYSKVNHDLRT